MIRLTRPKPIIESLSYNLIQRCSAGGTPKGKAKLKTGQPLKRNKISTKKGSKPPGSESGDEPAKGKGRISDEKQKLYEQCLNAPCPIRSLTPKEASREAQREKLGLISKDKQREIEIQKKGGAAAMGINTEPMRIGTSGLDYVSLGILGVDELVEYKVTAEDGERLAKENSKVLMREHRERRKAETVLLNMKKAAIEALPEKLRVAALEPDLTPFPANRGMATLTPPIEGYLEKVMDAAKKSSSKEKLR